MAERVEIGQLAECLASLSLASDPKNELIIRIVFYNKASDAFTALQNTVLRQLEECRQELEELKKGQGSYDYS